MRRHSGTFQGLFGPTSGRRFYAELMADNCRASIVRLATRLLMKSTAIPWQVVVLGIVAVSASGLRAVVVAPPIASFALTVALAAAWCVWLEKHPDAAARVRGNGTRALPSQTGQPAAYSSQQRAGW
jgi:hypothetical protein